MQISLRNWTLGSQGGTFCTKGMIRTAPKAGLIKTEVNNSGPPKYLRPCSVNTINTELTEISSKTLGKRAETDLGLWEGDQRVKQILVVVFSFKN